MYKVFNTRTQRFIAVSDSKFDAVAAARAAADATGWLHLVWAVDAHMYVAHIYPNGKSSY